MSAHTKFWNERTLTIAYLELEDWESRRAVRPLGVSPTFERNYDAQSWMTGWPATRWPNWRSRRTTCVTLPLHTAA